MSLIEIILTALTVILLFNVNLIHSHEKTYKILLAIAVACMVLQLVVAPFRWQMTLTYVTVLALAFLSFKRSIAHISLRIFGVVIGLSCLGTSVLYATMMPIMVLDAPQGSHTIGVTRFALTDTGRDEMMTPKLSDKRKLFVEVWYPGLPEVEAQRDTFWSGLYSGNIDVISFFTRYLKSIKTHALIDIEPAVGSYPLILFNHGLQMFTSQNTLLMEHLASHGYVVVSIGHSYESIRVVLDDGDAQLPDFITSFEKFSQGMAWIADASRPILIAQDTIKSLVDRHARSEIMINAIEQAHGLNTTVATWAADNAFILDQLLSGSDTVPANVPKFDAANIGVMGMSIGGAAAGELAKTDQRIKAGMNIDGLQYGKTTSSQLNVPFLMFYSEDGKGLNDFLFINSTHDYYEYYLPKSRHADLTDMAIVWPILKIYGQSGELSGPDVQRTLNTVTLNFWDYYLKGRTDQVLTTSNTKDLMIDFKIKTYD